MNSHLPSAELALEGGLRDVEHYWAAVRAGEGVFGVFQLPDKALHLAH